MGITMGQIDNTRIKSCMRRAQDGEELTIGFFGGSITQGCLASVHEKSYARRVFDWWQETFPQADFHYVNGGIGGTTSHFGVSRVVQDLLMYQPDMVFVDFSVNDREEEIFKETYEGLIRRILGWRTRPAVLILNNVYYDTGRNVQTYHNEVADWYHVPHVSMKDTLYQRMKEGLYTQEELTEDGLHPNDKGHGLVASEIIARLEEIRKELPQKNREEAPLPEPLTKNAYEHARRLTIREASPELQGFRADTKEKEGHLDLFKNGWIGRKPGDRIVFETEASCIGIQYRKTIRRPALRSELVLDGDREHTFILDGNFEADWGDLAELEPVVQHGERKRHRIEIEILDDRLKAAAPFYLMSFIIA